MIQIRAKLNEAQKQRLFKKLDALASLSSNVDMLDDMGQEAVDVIKKNIRTGKKDLSTNTSWIPLSNRRIQERSAKGNLNKGLLWDTGTLLNSINHAIGRKSVTLFSTDDNSKTDLLQNGGINDEGLTVPGRPFLTGGKPIEDLMVRILTKHVKRIIN